MIPLLSPISCLHFLIGTSRYARDKSWLAGERRRALSAIEALVEKVRLDHRYTYVFFGISTSIVDRTTPCLLLPHIVV